MLALGANARGRAGLLAALRPQDVFATSLYTGTGASQRITNGLDLLGSGGLVWQKLRSTAGNHALTDSVRGVNKGLFSNLTDAETAGVGASALYNNGFDNGIAYGSGATIAAWSFCRAAKFFDIVTYTGDGTSGRQIPHGLGVAPGMAIFKRLDAAEDWYVYHRGVVSPNANWWTNFLRLNATAASAADTAPPGQPTATTITVNVDFLNASGKRYVVILFAHDPDTTNGIIQCGSFTVTANGQLVPLGWRPQWGVLRRIDAADNWRIVDVARGWVTGGALNELRANTSEAELSTGGAGGPQPTGFENGDAYPIGAQVAYCMIRAPT